MVESIVNVALRGASLHTVHTATVSQTPVSLTDPGQTTGLKGILNSTQSNRNTAVENMTGRRDVRGQGLRALTGHLKRGAEMIKT